jgi:hypothetical protein
MSCCGQGRAALRAGQQERRPELDAPVAVLFTGSAPIVVSGPVTGFAYVFPVGSPLLVDGRDAQGILSLGAFVPA